MNERLKELAEQSGVLFDIDPTYTYGASPAVLERFANLVRQDEREAIAKSLEVTYAKGDGTAGWFDILAKDIRERGNHD
jgi:hypothetical protein